VLHRSHIFSTNADHPANLSSCLCTSQSFCEKKQQKMIGAKVSVVTNYHWISYTLWPAFLLRHHQLHHTASEDQVWRTCLLVCWASYMEQSSCRIALHIRQYCF